MDTQPVTLDMHGLLQLGLMTQQLREQQRHNEMIEQHQTAQTEAYTQSHEISGLIQTLDSSTIPAFVKYPALKRLMNINKQRTGGNFTNSIDVDPGEYSQAQDLYNNVAKLAATKGPSAPETQQAYQALSQSPYATMFNASMRPVLEEAQKMAQARGWQALGGQALGGELSPDQGQAIASSPQAQTKVADVLAKSQIERQTTGAIQAQADALGGQAGLLDQSRKFLVTHANPSINLTAESQYLSTIFPDGKLGKVSSALIGTPIYDELARKTGTLSSNERSALTSSLKDQVQQLVAKQNELNQEWRVAHFDAATDTVRDKQTVEQELNAVQSAIQLKSAEMSYASNPSAETLNQLTTVRQTLDQQLEQNKQQSDSLKAQRVELLQGASGEKMREFNVNQTYQKNLRLAQQEYTQGDLTTKNAGLIAQKYNVKPSDVIEAGKDVNKPLVAVNTNVPASEEAQKDFIKSSRTTYDQLKSAPAQLRNLEEAKAIIPQAKAFMGPGGETLLEAAKFLNNRLGFSVKTEGIKGAEELRSRIFFNIMDNLKKMDAQPSQLQQQIMMDSLGKLGTDPAALVNVLNAYEDSIRNKVETHNTEMEGAIRQGVKFPYDPRIKLPARAGAAAISSTGPLSQAEQDRLNALRKKYGR